MKQTMPNRFRTTLAPLFLLFCTCAVTNAFSVKSTTRVIQPDRVFSRNVFVGRLPLAVTSIDTNANVGKKRLAAGMGFLTGWADMVLSAKLATFCSMMTGNLLWLIKALADWRWRDGMYYASVIAAYGVGLAVYRKAQIKNQNFLPTMAATVGILFVLADLLLIRSSNFVYVKLLPACCLSFAFALVNGVGNDTAGTMTFVVTGHMTKMITSIVDDRAADRTSSWKATADRLLQQNAFRTQLVVFWGFAGGAMFANALRLNGIVDGQFASIGLMFSGLFLWKDSITNKILWFSRRTKHIPAVTESRVSPVDVLDVPNEENSEATTTTTTTSTAILDNISLLDSGILSSSFATELLPSQSGPIDSTLDLITAATSFNITIPLSP